MIIELRTYTLHPGKSSDFLRIYVAEGLEVQTRVLGNLLGYFTTEAGILNQFVHLWGYDSFDDRLRRRASLLSDPSWQHYLELVMPLIQRQESTILRPTAFSPIR
jgi:hypothetical protein